MVHSEEKDLEITDIDCLIIGAGVIGLAIARALSKNGREVFVIEKNERFGEETSSRNSEVIHAGIYYPKGSLKAKFCVEGRALLYDYCNSRKIPYQKCGKLIVATYEAQHSDLLRIQKQAEENGVLGEDKLTLFDQSTLKSLEPEVAGVSALFSPSTGIINSHAFMQSLIEESEGLGALFVYSHEALGSLRFRGQQIIRIKDPSGKILGLRCRTVINSTGLQAQQIAKSFDDPAFEKIQEASFIPKLHLSKGNYFSLVGSRPFKRLIYPVPTPNTLGIHATLDLGGQCRFGPDHEEISEIDYHVDESRSQNFYSAIRKYYPNLKSNSLIPAYSGIRPQLYRKGQSPADFMIQSRPSDSEGRPHFVHLYGIESPGLTASLSIAQFVADLVERVEK